MKTTPIPHCHFLKSMVGLTWGQNDNGEALDMQGNTGVIGCLMILSNWHPAAKATIGKSHSTSSSTHRMRGNHPVLVWFPIDLL